MRAHAHTNTLTYTSPADQDHQIQIVHLITRYVADVAFATTALLRTRCTVAARAEAHFVALMAGAQPSVCPPPAGAP